MLSPRFLCLRILASDVVVREPLDLDISSRLYGNGIDLELDVQAFDVPGKIPALYLEDERAGPNFGTSTGDTVGLRISDPATGKAFVYIPGCSEIDGSVRKQLQGASHVFFDGTFYDDEEMIRAGLMNKSGPRIGHISMSGPEGSIAKLKGLGASRKIYVHINI